MPVSARPLVFLVSLLMPEAALAQFIPIPVPSLAGTREVGAFLSGRVLSREYSADAGKTAFGAAISFAHHLTSTLALEAAVSGNYGRQSDSFYRSPVLTFTPTIGVLVQRSTAIDFQPYALVGGGLEFVRYTSSRCNCDQSRSRGIGNLGLGVRRMLGSRRALRFEVSSQIGKGAPAFTALAGMSWILGSRERVVTTRIPNRRRPEPPLLPVPKQTTTIQPATPPAAPAPAPVESVTATRPPRPLPTRVGGVLVTFDGTQVNFANPAWLDEAKPLLDELVTDLTSESGLRVTFTIEAHTDGVGSNADNMVIGLARARAVRDYLVRHGIAAGRITIASAGGGSPVASNATETGRQRNRRIVIKRDN